MGSIRINAVICDRCKKNYVILEPGSSMVEVKRYAFTRKGWSKHRVEGKTQKDMVCNDCTLPLLQKKQRAKGIPVPDTKKETDQ